MEIKGPNGIPAITITTPVSPTSASNPNPQSTPKVTAEVNSFLQAVFQVGKFVDAVVQKLEGQQLLLMLKEPYIAPDGQKLNLQLRTNILPIPLRVGDTVTLEINANKNNIPQLNVRQVTPGNLIPSLLAKTQQQTQAPLKQLLDMVIQQQTRNNPQISLPERTQAQTEMFMRSLYNNEQLQFPKEMRNALNQSGPFLQYQLATRPSQLHSSKDVQANLLRLAEAIRSDLAIQDKRTSSLTIAHQNTLTTAEKNFTTAPKANQTIIPEQGTKQAQSVDKTIQGTANQPQANQTNTALLKANELEFLLNELLRHTETNLNRILAQQANTLTSEANKLQWSTELPVKHKDYVDVFDLHIQRDKDGQEKNGDEKFKWTFNMEFDLEGLGKMHVKLALIGDEISSHWWIEQQPSATLFNKHLDFFENRLKTAGLNIDKLYCSAGKPNSTKFEANTATLSSTQDKQQT